LIESIAFKKGFANPKQWLDNVGLSLSQINGFTLRGEDYGHLYYTILQLLKIVYLLTLLSQLNPFSRRLNRSGNRFGVFWGYRLLPTA